MKKKTVALLLALALVFGGAVGGTIAWLTAETDPVVNTFTTAGIKITLIETKKPDGTDVAAGVTDWSAQLVPGKEYSKNPIVSVVRPDTDVDIYLFVKFEENNNPSTYLNYTSNLTTANGWNLVTGQTNVWYREVGAEDTILSWNLLDGDKVTVKDTLTKTEMPAANAAPALKYTAYAIQKDGFTDAADAWDEIGS